MSKSTHKIPAGFHTVTPHLIIKDAAKAIDFYKKAFGAEELSRLPSPDGRLMHASLKFGDSIVFLCDEFPEHECGLSPSSLKTAHAVMHVYVEDVDAAYKKAVDAGATAVMPPQEMFWGDRYGRLVDPFGQPWSLATHTQDLTPEQIQEGMKQMCGAAAKETCNA
jgi:uncharacterized glyoxalase superfamily protein PhnB